MSAGEPGRVELEAAARQAVGGVEVAAVLGRHREVAQQHRVLPHGLHAPRDPSLAFGGAVGLRAHLEQERGDHRAHQVAGVGVVVGQPRRHRRPAAALDRLGDGGDEAPFPLVLLPPPVVPPRASDRASSGRVRERRPQRRRRPPDREARVLGHDLLQQLDVSRTPIVVSPHRRAVRRRDLRRTRDRHAPGIRDRHGSDGTSKAIALLPGQYFALEAERSPAHRGSLGGPSAPSPVGAALTFVAFWSGWPQVLGATAIVLALEHRRRVGGFSVGTATSALVGTAALAASAFICVTG